MDKKFKWDMFVTSFIPLWLSIIVYDIYAFVESWINIWDCDLEISDKLIKVVQVVWLDVIVIITCSLIVIVSIVSLSNF